MVKTLKRYLSNPFVWAAFVCAALIYSGAVKVSSRIRLHCLFENPTLFYGTVSSNPVKTSGGRFYSFTLSPFLAEKPSEDSLYTCKSECSGRVKVLVPANIAESLYPGKLYSAGAQGDASGVKKGALIEINEKVLVKGEFSEDGSMFLAKNVQNIDEAKWLSLGNGMGQKKENRISVFLFHQRALYRLSLKRLLYSWGEAGGLVLSLLSGSREYLEGDLSDGFRRAGLSHILALSGMHLGFFFSLSSVLGIGIAGKRNSWVVSLVVLSLFVSFVGFTPSLTRSFIFILFIMLSKKVYCKGVDNFELLCLVFLIHTVILPDDLFQVSFMLSYCALAGILLLGPLISRFLVRVCPKKTSDVLSASFSAQAFTFPVSLMTFGEVMPIGILATGFVSPLITVFMSLSLFGIIICLVMPFLSTPFGCIMNLLYRVICFIVGIFARVPPLSF